jgi:predicted Zn-dependent protease
MTKTLTENQATVLRLMEQMEQQSIQIKSLQVNFVNTGNVNMITMIVKDSQIQRAVDLQRCINCVKQINFVLNVHVEA